MKIDHSISPLGHVRSAKKLLTINSNAGSPELASLFEITGLVVVHALHGVVETAALAASITGVYLDVFPTAGAAVVLTKIAGGPALSSFEASSLLVKDKEAAQILTVSRANVAIFEEADATFREVIKEFHLGKKSGAVTTVRMVYTAGGDYTSETGQIHWEIVWEAVSDDGMVVPV